MKRFLQTQFPVLILFSATVKQRLSAESIVMKISVLPPTQQVFTVIVLPILQQILQMFEKGYHHNDLFYSYTKVPCSLFVEEP